MYTLNQTISWAQGYIEYLPLTAGTGMEPALSIASMVRNTILNPPLTWPFNRAEWLINTPNTPASLTAGVQDYVFPITNFSYLEKVSLLGVSPTGNGAMYGFELKDIYNTYILGVPYTGTAGQAQPNGVAVKYYTPCSNVAMRFLSVPDQSYTGVITYQKTPLPFTEYSLEAVDVISGVAYYSFTNPQGCPLVSNLNSFVGQDMYVSGFDIATNNGTFTVIAITSTYVILNNPNAVTDVASATMVNIDWFPIPDSFMDVFNNLFLAEALTVADDPKEQIYRQRGIAALLAKAEGLSDMDRNVFLMQYLSRGTVQQLAAQQRVQQGSQARGV